MDTHIRIQERRFIKTKQLWIEECKVIEQHYSWDAPDRDIVSPYCNQLRKMFESEHFRLGRLKDLREVIIRNNK